MKVNSKVVELLIEHRVRDKARMLRASKAIDRLRRKAPRGWKSEEVIRQIRESR